MIAALVLLAAAGAVAFFALAGTETGSTSSQSGSVAVPGPTIIDESAPIPPESNAPPAPVDLVGESLTPALDELADRIGPSYRIQRLVVYPGYMVAYVEPPDLPGELDRWIIYPGTNVVGPDPEQNPSAELESELFGVAELDLTVLATLGERAAVELGIEPTTTYLIVDRSRADDNQVTVSAYVSNERRSGYVVFALDGTLLDSYGG